MNILPSFHTNTFVYAPIVHVHEVLYETFVQFGDVIKEGGRVLGLLICQRTLIKVWCLLPESKHVFILKCSSFEQKTNDEKQTGNSSSINICLITSEQVIYILLSFVILQITQTNICDIYMYTVVCFLKPTNKYFGTCTLLQSDPNEYEYWILINEHD